MSSIPTWTTPEQMLADFDAFLETTRSHIVQEERVVYDKTTSSYITKKIDVYVPENVVSIIQFAAWKGCHKTTIYNEYSSGDYQAAYQQIKSVCEAYAERQLYAKDHPTGVIFALKNNHDWVDETKTELSGGLSNKNDLTPEAAAILAKASRASDGTTEPD